MPYTVAKDLQLCIDRRRSQRIRLSQGFAQTVGTVQFGLTINGITKQIKAVLLNGFQYTLLMSINTCSAFSLIIDTTTRTAKTDLKQTSPKTSKSTTHTTRPVTNFDATGQ